MSTSQLRRTAAERLPESWSLQSDRAGSAGTRSRTARATTAATTAMVTEPARQPSALPRCAVAGTPRTEAAETPPKTTAVATGTRARGTSRGAIPAATGPEPAHPDPDPPRLRRGRHGRELPRRPVRGPQPSTRDPADRCRHHGDPVRAAHGRRRAGVDHGPDDRLGRGVRRQLGDPAAVAAAGLRAGWTARHLGLRVGLQRLRGRWCRRRRGRDRRDRHRRLGSRGRRRPPADRGTDGVPQSATSIDDGTHA